MPEIPDLIIFPLGLAAASVIAGLIAGLLGVGGGIVLVPVLYWMLPWLGADDAVRMHVAVGTSLATIIATGFVSARSHAKRGNIAWDVIKEWWLPVMAGTIVGALVAARLKGDLLTGIFAVLALAVAIRLAFFGKAGETAAHTPPRPVYWLAAGVTGFVSSLMGIGGGTLSVPALVAFNHPMRRAVGTAAALGLVIALPGTITFIAEGWDQPGLPPYSAGYVNFLAVAIIIPVTMTMAPIGAHLAHAANPLWLRRIFALFLGATAIRMAINVLT